LTQASTDFRPYLEYQAPKGIAVPHDTVAPNVAFLEGFRSPGLPAAFGYSELPAEDERNLMLGYVAEGRRDMAQALYFRRINGPTGKLAEVETARLASGVARQQAVRVLVKTN
jgi:hypothetical protein